MLKNSVNFGLTAIALAMLISAFVCKSAIQNRNSKENVLSVKGSASKDFESDLIVWTAYFDRLDYDLKTAFEKLNSDKNMIKNFLISRGISDKDIVFSAVSITKQYDYVYNEQGGLASQTFRGYNLHQNIEIKSKDLNKVEQVSREITDLIQKGVELNSTAPKYYYTKLSELKHALLAEAAKDAYERAKKIAENSDGDMGKLKKAVMGIFQITGQYSDEDYSWGGAFNTSSRQKTATITVDLEYILD